MYSRECRQQQREAAKGWNLNFKTNNNKPNTNQQHQNSPSPLLLSPTNSTNCTNQQHQVFPSSPFPIIGGSRQYMHLSEHIINSTALQAKHIGCNKRCWMPNRSIDSIRNNMPKAYSHTIKFKKRGRKRDCWKNNFNRWMKAAHFSCVNDSNMCTYAHTKIQSIVSDTEMNEENQFSFPHSFNKFSPPALNISSQRESMLHFAPINN